MKPTLLGPLQLNSIPGLGRQVSYTYLMTEAEPAKMLHFFKQNKKMENVHYVYKFNDRWWLMCNVSNSSLSASFYAWGLYIFSYKNN
jgi:hypothetical protein